LPDSGFTVEVEGVDRLRRKLDASKVPWRAVIEDAAKFAQAKAAEYAKPHPVDTGALGAKISFKLSASPTALEAYVRPNRAVVGLARTVEEGRRPGKPPPAATIERWARRHGIRESGWKLAQEIRRRGTKGVKMFERAAKETEKKLPELIGKAAKAIERKFGS
jgi:hypothetical protein